MRRDLKDIAAEALDLPLTARAELASQLLASLDDLSEEETDVLWAYVRRSNRLGRAIPQDPIVEKIHRIREELLERYGGPDGYMKHIKELEEELKDRIVSREPRPPVVPGRKG